MKSQKSALAGVQCCVKPINAVAKPINCMYKKLFHRNNLWTDLNCSKTFGSSKG